jgi:hypothetical protein
MLIPNKASEDIIDMILVEVLTAASRSYVPPL